MANEKLTQLPAVTSLQPNDLLYSSTDSLGTPVSNKITFSNFENSITTLDNVEDLTISNDLTISDLTEGSVVIVGPAGLISEDNTNLFFDEANVQLLVNGKSSGSFGNSQFPFVVGGNTNNFIALEIQNSNGGDTATTDISISADNDSTNLVGHYIDMGMASSTYNATTAGNIQAISINTAGTGYMVNDVLTINTGNADATVTVLTVGGGGDVLTIDLANSGSGYSVGSARTTTGGTGTGFKVNILSIVNFTLTGANDGYQYVSGGNLVIFTDSLGTTIKFAVEGGGTVNEVLEITPSGITVGLAGTTLGKVKFAGSTSSSTTVKGPAIGAGENSLQGVTDTFVYRNTTDVLTNKALIRRVVTTNAPGATPATNVDNVDIQEFTGLANNITSMTTNLTGTPYDGQMIEFIFLDNGTPRTIAYGSSFANGGLVSLPLVTVASTPLRLLVQYQTMASLNKYVAISVA